jgi:hypothetical protein
MKMTTSTNSLPPEEAKILGATLCEFSTNLSFEALIINNEFSRYRNDYRGGLASLICRDQYAQHVITYNGEIHFNERGEFDPLHGNHNKLLATYWSAYGFHAFKQQFEKAIKLATKQ